MCAGELYINTNNCVILSRIGKLKLNYIHLVQETEKEPMIKKFKKPEEYQEGDIIISSDEIDNRLDELAAQLAKEYKEKRALLVGLLTGAAWVTVDLFERLHILGITDAQLTFMKVSSYQNGDSATYEPRIEYDMLINPKERHVILVDDIADTGKTLAQVAVLLKSKDVASITSIVLIDKPERREISYKPDYIGFEIPNIWIQGRGMDSDGYGRGDPNVRKGPYHY
jgi:hypoxanthine phosphoribosyltransferase